MHPRFRWWLHRLLLLRHEHRRADREPRHPSSDTDRPEMPKWKQARAETWLIISAPQGPRATVSCPELWCHGPQHQPVNRHQLHEVVSSRPNQPSTLGLRPMPAGCRRRRRRRRYQIPPSPVADLQLLQRPEALGHRVTNPVTLKYPRIQQPARWLILFERGHPGSLVITASHARSRPSELPGTRMT